MILPPEVAREVINGSRSICAEAGIPLAGGHSIDTPEPIFGLAVNGFAKLENIRRNNTAKEGDLLFLTKPLGVGILTTAEKKGLLEKEHEGLAAEWMSLLNKPCQAFGKLKGVHAMTDVTGFGLLGHLMEMASGSGLSVDLNFEAVPLITPDLPWYIENKAVPGGTQRNWDSYGNKVEGHSELQKAILADPQTSGGLLIAVDPSEAEAVIRTMRDYGVEKFTTSIGIMKKEGAFAVTVK